MNQEKIGKYILALRKKYNLTQKEFADKFGVTYQAVSKWENGKNIPDIAILKEISREFNIDINDILDGNKISNKKRHYSVIILSVLLMLTISITLLLVLTHDHDFVLKPISSSCKQFSIYGSVAYNKDKSSIYISKINYCNDSDKEIYKKIDCSLYEKKDNMETKISECNTSNNSDITLADYLDSVKIKVNDYATSCRKLSDRGIYLEINAINQHDKTITYKIPLEMEDDCFK